MHNTDHKHPTELPRLPEVKKLFEWAFDFYKRNLGVILGISLLPFISGLAILLEDKSPADSLGGVGLGGVLLFLNIIFGLLSNLALYSLVTKEGRSVTDAYKNGVRMLVPFLWVSILVILAETGGFVLFIIPGIIISLWLSLSPYVLFAENRRGTNALVGSWYYAKGYWLAILGRSLVLVFIFLIVSFAIEFAAGNPVLDLVLENFVFVPFFLIYSYGIYQSLREIKPSPAPESVRQEIKSNIKAFSVIGIIGTLVFLAVFGWMAVTYDDFWPMFLDEVNSGTSI